MAPPKILTEAERDRARIFLTAAQGTLGNTIRLLRHYQAISGDERVHYIILALEARRSQRDDCLAPTYNLDDALKALDAPGEEH